MTSSGNNRSASRPHGAWRLRLHCPVLFGGLATMISAIPTPGAVIVPLSQNRFVRAAAFTNTIVVNAPDFSAFDADVSAVDPRTDIPPLSAQASQHSQLSATVVAANGCARVLAPLGGNQFSVTSGGGVTFTLAESTPFALVGQFQFNGSNVFPTYSAAIRDSNSNVLWRIGDNGTNAACRILSPGTYTVGGGASGAAAQQIRSVNIDFAWYFAIPSPSGGLALVMGAVCSLRRPLRRRNP